MLERPAGNKHTNPHEVKATPTPASSELHALSFSPAGMGFIQEVSQVLQSAHFACTLSGTIEGPLKLRGGGNLTLTATNTKGEPIATFATPHGALTAADITHLCRLFNPTERPNLALASCVRYLHDIAGIELRPLADWLWKPAHPEIPGALSRIPGLDAFIQDPDAVPNHFSVHRPAGETVDDCVVGEVRPLEGILLLTIERREGGTVSTRRFRVTSPATLELPDAPRREHLLQLARFLVMEFSAQGSEALVDQLEGLTPPAQELPAKDAAALVTDSELLWSKFPDDLAQVRLNSQTGTTTKLFLGESRAAIVIAPDEDLQGTTQPLILFTNSALPQQLPLSDGQLEYIRRAFELLSSHLWSERSSGMRMIFSVGAERAAAFEANDELAKNSPTSSSLRFRGQLRALNIDRDSRSTNFLSDFPGSVLAETALHDWIKVAADSPTSRDTFADALENSATRCYTMLSRRVPWRLELLQSMRITRRADGMMSVSATTPFGAKILGRMAGTIGLPVEEVDQREVALVRAFARQKFSGWLTLQQEIETQMYGSDALDKSEGGVWDGCLVGLPPRSDAAGIQALTLAGTLVHQAMRFQHTDEATFRAAWLAPGRVVMRVNPTDTNRFLELSLCGDRLEELRIGRTNASNASFSFPGQSEEGKGLKVTQSRFQPGDPLNLGPEEQLHVSQIIRNYVDFDSVYSSQSGSPRAALVSGDDILTAFFDKRFKRLSP